MKNTKQMKVKRLIELVVKKKLNEEGFGTNYKFNIGDELECYGGGEYVVVRAIKPNVFAALKDKRDGEVYDALVNYVEELKQDGNFRTDKNKPWYLVEFEESGGELRYWPESELLEREEY